MTDTKSLVSTLDRYHANVMRASKLLEFTQEESAKSADGILNQKGMDVVRSAVVFLHAAFEDFLRELCRQFWLQGNPDKWDFPFMETSGDVGTKTTVSMSVLAGFKGMTVDDLIRKSFEASLERRSYNTFRDVCRLLEGIGIPKDIFQKYASHVCFIMQRRHRIVHQCDFENSTATEPADWPQSDAAKVAIAAIAMRTLSIELVHALGFQELNIASAISASRQQALTFTSAAGISPNDDFPFK